MKNFYTYILKCADGSYYIGHTDCIEQRIAEHMDGKGGLYTAKRLPITLVFLQEFATRDEAYNVEHQIKKWTRKKKIALIAQNWENLKLLAKKKYSYFNEIID